MSTPRDGTVESKPPTSSSARPVFVVAAGIFPDPSRVERTYGAQAEVRWADLSTPQRVREATDDADALVVSTQRLDRSCLEAVGAHLRLISRAGVGLDAIDLQAAASLGITVINQPAYGAVEVAGHALAMLLTLQRRLSSSDAFVRAGWSGPLELAPMAALDELTLGLVGCGRIGGELARLAVPLVGRIRAHDPMAASLPPNVERTDHLDDLLSSAQIVSVHVPLTPQTRGLLAERELSQLPAGAILINVSRGGIVDEDALAAALRSGHVAAAGLDVFAVEPPPPDAAILAAPRTILTPHVAAYSERSSWRLASWSFDDALAWLADRRVEHGTVVVAGTR